MAAKKKSPKSFIYVFIAVLFLVIQAPEGAAADWVEINTGLGNLDVRVIAIDPVHPEIVYAGGSGGLFKSFDGGATWNATGLMTSGETITNIPGLPPLPRPIQTSNAVVRLAIDFSDPNTLYAAMLLQGGCAFYQRRVLKSTDGGASWTDSISPNINGCDNIHAFILAPSDPATFSTTLCGTRGRRSSEQPIALRVGRISGIRFSGSWP
jgi:hypothetical protein